MGKPGHFNKIFLNMTRKRGFDNAQTQFDFTLFETGKIGSPLVIKADIYFNFFEIKHDGDRKHANTIFQEFFYSIAFFSSIDGIQDVMSLEKFALLEIEYPAAMVDFRHAVASIQRDIAISYMKNFLKIGELVDFSVTNEFSERFLISKIQNF